MAFKDFFIKEEEPKPSVSPQNRQQVSPQPAQMETSAFSGQPAAPQSAVVQTGEVNENIVKSLWQVLIDKNLPGPDYLEVKNNASALKEMNLPIEKCYEAGFRTLKASYPDFTKEALLASIDTYIGIVRQEQADGKKECDAKRQTQIGDKTVRIGQLGEHKRDLEKQISELRSQIASTDASISQLQAEVDTDTAEIDKEEAVFDNSVENVIATLNDDKEIMSRLNV
jgi:hypothetical protein